MEARRGESADRFRASAVALTSVTGPWRRGSAANAPHDGLKDFEARCRWTQKAINFAESHETSEFAFVLSAGIFFALTVGHYSRIILQES